jgi:hypothetical protein
MKKIGVFDRKRQEKTGKDRGKTGKDRGKTGKTGTPEKMPEKMLLKSHRCDRV